MLKIQGLTFNKRGNIVCVLQTLFLDQEPNQLGNKSNRGSKIECDDVLSPGKYSKFGISVAMMIGIPRSPKFVKQHELSQK